MRCCFCEGSFLIVASPTVALTACVKQGLFFYTHRLHCCCGLWRCRRWRWCLRNTNTRARRPRHSFHVWHVSCIVLLSRFIASYTVRLNCACRQKERVYINYPKSKHWIYSCICKQTNVCVYKDGLWDSLNLHWIMLMCFFATHDAVDIGFVTTGRDVNSVSLPSITFACA